MSVSTKSHGCSYRGAECSTRRERIRPFDGRTRDDRDEDIGFVGTQLARKAAEKVFLEKTGEWDRGEEIVDWLGETFICGLIDHQLLSRVRPSLTEKNHRSIEDQRKWEGELLDTLKPLARKLFHSALKSEDKNAIRAPKRTATPPPPLEIRLHEPLVPLQGSNVG